MQSKKIKISEIKLNPNNPRLIKDDKFEKLVKSIKDFPEMLDIRPIVVNSDMVILGGNMRFKACKEAGLKEVPIIIADNLTEEQQREFLIKDNVSGGEWDWNLLSEWDTEQLEEWGLDVPSFETDEVLNEKDDNELLAIEKLSDRYLIPPFSILNTRDGLWQERKKNWKLLIKDFGESREETLGSGGITIDENSSSWMHNPKLGNGVSLLDPVLSELINLWFGLPNSKTFDCFAGDSVFGYVSSYMGNSFTGIELRKEQTDLNNERIKGFNSKYICDDGRNILNHIKENSQDLLFSCPPYFDLEVYSDLPNDASNQQDYEDFLKILDAAFSNAIKCLKENRFAVITVGDIRDKKGFYYRFVDDIKDIFKKNNLLLYNELILIEPIAFGAIRAEGNMKNRKITKCHQNVLVFYKGNPKEIKNIYPKIEINESTDV
jgi:DNA modification methylase